jgi:hypothetical protein
VLPWNRYPNIALPLRAVYLRRNTSAITANIQMAERIPTLTPPIHHHMVSHLRCAL